MPSLPTIESQIIEALLVKEYGPTSPLLRQLAAATVGSRQMTGTGYYLDLVVGGDAPRADRLNGDASGGFQTRLEPPADLVGFTVFIRDGYLSWLEGYTFGDVKWPDEPMEEWLLLDAPSRAKAAGDRA